MATDGEDVNHPANNNKEIKAFWVVDNSHEAALNTIWRKLDRLADKSDALGVNTNISQPEEGGGGARAIARGHPNN